MRIALLLSAVATGCTTVVCSNGFAEAGGLCTKSAPACDPACGTHEVCAAQNTCECAPGYGDEPPCAWAGVVGDPGFQERRDAEGELFWSEFRGGNILPDQRDTVVDRGAAFFDGSVVCNAGTVDQLLEMPPYEVAEPLVAEIVYQAFQNEVHGVGVGFNDAWRTLPTISSSEVGWEAPDCADSAEGAYCREGGEGRFCLGESAYGGQVQLRIGGSERLNNCLEGGDPPGTITVDYFDIKPANVGECPAPGEVLNGDAERSGGWMFDGVGDWTGGLTGGAGRGSSGGARIAVTTDRQASLNLAAMATRISVPEPTEDGGPELSFWFQGTLSRLYNVEIGAFAEATDSRRLLDSLLGGGSEGTARYCLPSWSHGSVVDLAFVTVADQDGPTVLVVDDVALSINPDCSASPDLIEGFENGPTYRPAGIRNTEPGLASARLIAQPSDAHSGNGSLEIEYRSPEASLEAEFFFLVPPAASGFASGLEFYSRLPNDASATPTWVLGREAVDQGALTGLGWQRNIVCPPAAWAGRWFRLKIRVREQDTGADTPGGPPPLLAEPETLLIDDLAPALGDCPEPVESVQ